MHDNIWMLGYPPNDSLMQFGGSMLDFSGGDPNVSFFETSEHLGASVSMSDPNGNLIFYSNGCNIRNSKHEVIENGEMLMPGFAYEIRCNNSQFRDHYASYQSILALQMPERPEQYILFHQFRNDTFFRTSLNYSEIQFNIEYPNGIVTNKNKIALKDTLSPNLTATKHANGRDWWIITPENPSWQKLSNSYYTLLLTSDGVSEPSKQSIGERWERRDWSCQSIFSPDGSKYIRMNPFSGLFIYDFDRCEGILSNPQHFSFPLDTVMSGVAVSPNSKFLYTCLQDKIYQFDLSSDNIKESMVKVAEYDGFQDPLSTYFFQAMLAPNGKIYISSPNTVRSMTVIENPNEKGLTCNVNQHSLKLKTRIGWMTPNFVNYRLGEMEEGCDVNSVDKIDSKIDKIIFPNPSTGTIQINLPTDIGEVNFQLCDMGGQQIFIQNDVLPSEEIHLINIANGLYFYKIFDSQGRSWSGKVVVAQ